MSKTKVLFAYCHELDRALSINDARTEFFSISERHRKRFTFSCSDRHCNVSITGVNYHVKAEDGHKFKEAHFRSHVPHRFGCEWLLFTEETEQDKRPGESERDFSERRARQKLTDFINSFDPAMDDSDDSTASDYDSPASSRVAHQNGGRPQDASPVNFNHYTRTNQVQRLVDSWQEAKTKLSSEERRLLKLNVVNHGQIYFGQYFTHISKGLRNPYDGIVYGGAKLVRRYGRGFLMAFFDEYEEKPVKLYVSKEIMSRSRFGHYVDEILNTADVRYFRVFLLNPDISESDINGFRVLNLEVKKLRQLAIYFELNLSTEEDPTSLPK